MGVLKDLEKMMTPAEVDQNDNEYLAETAQLRAGFVIAA